ncbi:MFS transporter [Chitinophaga skermanii]|uniref:MFS transporter n=1 Tax=Chitinophaga skermanii TaxID=331697 RepID=A0A327Q7C0_9BACT|nr:MFS transporter [Chitinophaga skermanii]RAI99763.1 MFS transporter [Chitinophaga skermanii]
MHPESTSTKKTKILNAAVIVASLGYFVDIYDLLLFGIIRIKSLQSLGLNKEQIEEVGLALINYQMAGLLIGGIFWGILGDKRGRLSVLFGSILLYSVANIANGLIDGENAIVWYKIWRVVAGLGLAGELGAGITLVAEVLPKEKRGIGTMIVASIGISGAVAAYFVSQAFGENWRACYFIGGGLGLALLLLRVSVVESGMFHNSKQQTNVSRGNYLKFFTNGDRFKRYLKCILVGMPTWYVVGILVFFSNSFAEKLEVKGTVDPGKAIMICYAALTFGDLASGAISQWLKSRKKVLYIFYTMTLVSVLLYFSAHGVSVTTFYAICGLLGFSVGFWAIFVTMAAEQFGTNFRAMAATTAPNYARGMLNLITPIFLYLQVGLKDYFGSPYLASGLITGLLCILIAFVAAITSKETFGKDLDYVEEE